MTPIRQKRIGIILLLWFTLSSIGLIDGGVAGPLDVCMPCIGKSHLVSVRSVSISTNIIMIIINYLLFYPEETIFYR